LRREGKGGGGEGRYLLVEVIKSAIIKPMHKKKERQKQNKQKKRATRSTSDTYSDQEQLYAAACERFVFRALQHSRNGEWLTHSNFKRKSLKIEKKNERNSIYHREIVWCNTEENHLNEPGNKVIEGKNYSSTSYTTPF
jgi:hypothetical protein